MRAMPQPQVRPDQPEGILPLQSFFAKSELPKSRQHKGASRSSVRERQAKWEEATKDIRAKQKAIIDPVRAKATKYHKERYLTDSRESIFKPRRRVDSLRPLDQSPLGQRDGRDTGGYEIDGTCEDRQ